MIDLLVCLAIVATLFTVGNRVDPKPETVVGIAIFMAAVLALFVLPLIKDGFSGFSPGKWLMDLRVVNRNTLEPIGPLASLGRNAIPVLFPLGAMIIAMRLEDGYRMGDALGRSKVIWLRYADHPVFTGRPLDEGDASGAEFATERVERPPAVQSANPYRPPQE